MLQPRVLLRAWQRKRENRLTPAVREALRLAAAAERLGEASRQKTEGVTLAADEMEYLLNELRLRETQKISGQSLEETSALDKNDQQAEEL